MQKFMGFSWKSVREQRSKPMIRFKTTAAKIAHGYWHLPRAFDWFSFVVGPDDDSTNSAACRSVSKFMFSLSQRFRSCWDELWVDLSPHKHPPQAMCVLLNNNTNANKALQIVQERLLIDWRWYQSTNQMQVIVVHVKSSNPRG